MGTPGEEQQKRNPDPTRPEKKVEKTSQITIVTRVREGLVRRGVIRAW